MQNLLAQAQRLLLALLLCTVVITVSCCSVGFSRLEAAQGAEVDLLALQQAAEVAQLQQEAVRIARELDAQQLLTHLQQQEMAAQQEQEQVGGQSGQCEVMRIVFWLFCF
jgi:uncharacterized membrane protein (DUF106 family)